MNVDEIEKPRVGDWMQTYTGRQVWPLDIRPGDVHPEDVAHALSMTCRYGGHTRLFYSVAEHCCLLTDHSLGLLPGDKELALALLLHDASEAYLGDIPRPLKHSLPKEWRVIERRADEVCITELGGVWPLPPEVKQMDNNALVDERVALMLPTDHAWITDGMAPMGLPIHGWSPARAKMEWLRRYDMLRS